MSMYENLKLNQDSLYEIICFLSPFEVLQLLKICKDWHKTILNSKYWEFECKKSWKITSELDSYYEYFKERIISLQNFTMATGYKKHKKFYGSPLENKLQFKQNIKLPSNTDKFLSIHLYGKSFLVHENQMTCLVWKDEKILWNRSFKMSKKPNICIDYSIIHTLLVLKFDLKIQVIHPEDGKTIWEKDVDTSSTDFIIRGAIIIYYDESAIYGLDIESGEEIWSKKFKSKCNFLGRTICSRNKTIAFCVFDGGVDILKFESFRQIPSFGSAGYSSDHCMIDGFFCRDYLILNGKDLEGINHSHNIVDLKEAYSLDSPYETGYPIETTFDEENKVIFISDYLTSRGTSLLDVSLSSHHLDKLNQFTKMSCLDPPDNDVEFENFYERNGLEFEVKLEKKFLRLFGSFTSNLYAKDNKVYFIAEWTESEVLFCCFSSEERYVCCEFIQTIPYVTSKAKDLNSNTFHLVLENEHMILINQEEMIVIDH